MKKAEKAFFVDNLTEELKNAKGIVLINYTGMSVKMQQDLKERLSGVGASMLVVKNTLLKRAGEKAGIDVQTLDASILSGQTALIIASEDALSPIQILGKFAKENETPKMKVGIVDGTFQDSAALATIATLPGKDVLLSQVLGALLSTQYGLVATLQGNIQKLVYVLDQKAKQGN
jgi:large subunit ribosomal protein L10